ncbi:MbcA/ParS/Xre antitoxin family protein [Deinococcus sedimenti]|uniref:Antitoxin Xre/MbcA/ParS-like toxin-binding domain-containing protein n=1 Tax=Deinococcus sedimenti TaxID=1867090 RepID=A0ABQ2SAM5_9DEIO|nr:MbcA/ParS/Xre antitoxin family protein [Deinococcus sedimenti]GGS06621.1 hypothetical protein GCM10008960_36250 [Deinococcus sedimenti]
MSKPPKVREITVLDSFVVADNAAVEQLRQLTGLTKDGVHRAVKNFEDRIRKSQRSLVQLESVAGGATMTVRASSLQPTARSFSSLKLDQLDLPGYRVKSMPTIDPKEQVLPALQRAVEALQMTFGESEDAQSWMQTPNDAFNGKTPVSVLEDGQPNAITTVLGAAREGVAL